MGTYITNIARGRRTTMGARGEQIPLVNEGTGAKAVDVHVNILRPDGPRGPYHYHPGNENVYIVLSGMGRLIVEGDEHILRKEDVVFIPPGEKHSLSAIGDENLVLIELYAPGKKESVYLD